MVLYGANWCYVVLCCRVLSGSIWCCLVLVLSGAMWCYRVLSGAIWCCLALSSAIWCYLVLSRARWCDVVLSGAIQSYIVVYVLSGSISGGESIFECYSMDDRMLGFFVYAQLFEPKLQRPFGVMPICCHSHNPPQSIHQPAL